MLNNQPSPLSIQQDTVWDQMAKEMCFESEKDMLTTFYETFSISEIAQKLGCGSTTISRRMKRLGIQPDRRGGHNAATDQRYKMFHIDQRKVMFIGTTRLAAELACGHSLLYKYKCWKTNKRGGS